MKITVYTSPSCPWGNSIKNLLTELNQTWEEIDVTKDHAAWSYTLRCALHEGVPVVDIGGKVIVGYKPEAIRQTIKHAKLSTTFQHRLDSSLN